jgi:methylphosphotriester-DNA--protein-cysteine methyltransferase
VSRAADVPAEHSVDRALERYLAECRDNGRRPSVLALAAELGMSNTTFRRHFPGQVRKISGLRREPGPGSRTAAGTGPSPYEQLTARNARLRRANRILTQNLRLAAAQVQRLSLDNARLREALQSTASVTPINQARRGPSR